MNNINDYSIDELYRIPVKPNSQHPTSGEINFKKVVVMAGVTFTCTIVFAIIINYAISSNAQMIMKHSEKMSGELLAAIDAIKCNAEPNASTPKSSKTVEHNSTTSGS